jgi:hypothetical protein
MAKVIAHGPSFGELSNGVSTAITAALARGMSVEEATCVVVQVAADYARRAYGSACLQQLAEVVIWRGSRPNPGEASDG